MIYRMPGFVVVIRFALSIPSPPLPSVNKLDQRHTGILKKRDNFLVGRKGGGVTG
jgi:hypothetical protein